MRQKAQLLLLRLFDVAQKTKLGIIFFLDIVFSFLAASLALTLTTAFTWRDLELLQLAVGVMCIRVAVFAVFRLYSYSWRFASTRQFKFMYGVIMLGSGVVALFGYFVGSEVLNAALGMFLLLEWMGSMCFLFSFRGALRLLRDELMILTKRNLKSSTVPILVIGAGSAGAMLVNESLKNPDIKYEIKGFLDDDVRKVGQRIHGVKVKGLVSDLEALANKEGVEDVVIAIPSATSLRIREIMALSGEAKLRFKITPSLPELFHNKVSLGQLRDIRIQDLLGRDEVEQMIIESSNNYIQGKCVLVTGGGGSIGSELCVQILKFQPDRLIVLDNCEDHVYQIDRKLRALFPDFEGLQSIVGDVACESDVNRVFEHNQIDVVFHAAAYKHVPLMEDNTPALMKNNIKGTRVILEHTRKHACERFILISTDKAVNPTNNMGASKRFCELLTLAYAKQHKMNASAVRFGNVLASRGSVVPLFREQIKQGGPITVTHPDITRYFMTIPEASRLVLQAGLLSTGGEIFTLDMGKPIKIIDLAKDMIRLSDRTETDIEIRYTGLRPGEKMYEELSYNPESITKTVHPKIYVEDEEAAQLLDELDAVLNDIQTSSEGFCWGLGKLGVERVLG